MTSTHDSQSRTFGRVSRRSFLLVGLAGSTALAMPTAVAVEDSTAFQSAGTAYGVPPALLAAISYGQSRWADHGGYPSRSMGYGPMHLIDGAAVAAMRRSEGKPADSTIDTLGQAAAVSGRSPASLRTDATANIHGAAALLASLQRAGGGAVGTGTDPASWYAAVAQLCGLTAPHAQLGFADDVLGDLRTGATVNEGGMRFTLKRQRVGDPGAGRTKVLERATRDTRSTGPMDAPAGLGVEWLPAPYTQYGPDPGDYGNHDLAFRPVKPRLTQVVIHDTECSYDVAIKLVSDPTYLAWNYTVRSSDGHIAQHLLTKDIGWHAGNWYVNMHSIGVEHEGYAAQGYTWYTEAMYRRSARLVAYLCRKYDIPIDRGHIIGHDQVPGGLNSTIAGMHWDPGPFWDWEHYFELMGASLKRQTIGRPPRAGDVVRILPGFDDNVQTVTGCAGPCVEGSHGTNFVPLHTSPDASSPLVTDPGIRSTASTTQVSDIGARATAGTDYVVAQVRGDWVAIWYLGAIAWFVSPRSHRTCRVVRGARSVTPVGATAAVYGRAYPEASAYSNPADAQTVAPLLYTLQKGQGYALLDTHVPTDYYKAKTYSLDTPNDHIDIVGTTRYYEINLGHRVGYVRADKVRIQ